MVQEAIAEPEVESPDLDLPDMPESPDEDDLELDVDDEGDDEAEDLEGDDAQDSDAAPEPKAPSQRTTDEWAALLEENGKNISRVPAAERAEVLQKYRDNYAQAQLTRAEMLAQQQQQNTLDWVQWTLSVLDRFAEDPDAEREFILGNSREAQAYVSWRDRIQPREYTPEAQAQAAQGQTLDQLMGEQVHLLADYPQLQTELAKLHDTQPYERSVAGLRRLTRDVAQLRDKGIEARLKAAAVPGKRSAQARKAASDDRRAMPRQDGGAGRPSGKAPSSLAEYESKLRDSSLTEAEWAQYERVRASAGLK